MTLRRIYPSTNASIFSFLLVAGEFWREVRPIYVNPPLQLVSMTCLLPRCRKLLFASAQVVLKRFLSIFSNLLNFFVISFLLFSLVVCWFLSCCLFSFFISLFIHFFLSFILSFFLFLFDA